MSMTVHSAFVSHAHADNDLCDRYIAALRAGYDVDLWYDRTNMEYAQVISEIIGRELEKRTALAVMLTPASIASGWVQLEVSTFLSLWTHERSLRTIIPVVLRPCSVPTILRAFNWIDATAQTIEQTAADIAQVLGVPARPVVPPPPPEPEEPAATPVETDSAKAIGVSTSQRAERRKKIAPTLPDGHMIVEIRELIVHDPQKGAEALRQYLWSVPSELLDEAEIDIAVIETKIGEMARLERQMRNFGETPEHKASRLEIIHYLIEACVRLERKFAE